ncbi:MAG: hypothetical protein AUH19_04800 [Verrucomicrobia bacterium 13_2_20CM_55_10]|nr:MAG: hypothetical protein AUH19_04800 [Verrucomicrobia bacterium 13_2_20CM_55_10]
MTINASASETYSSGVFVFFTIDGLEVLTHIATVECGSSHANEKLTAFLELESAIRGCGEFS